MIWSVSPGKLYIAGEYAVVEKGYPAVIVGLDGFIKVSLEETEGKGSIEAYDNNPIRFSRVDEKLVLDYRDNRLYYVINSIKIVEELAKELGKELKFYHLKVESELEDEKGRKYGLGSSAAVTVSTIKVLAKLYGIELTKREIFKLSALVHLEVDSNGSCGDIAASVYGGWISFKTFDRNWVIEEAKESSIKSMIEKNWPFLDIKKLDPPEDLKLLIGWTGKPASTTRLVDDVKIKRNKSEKEDYYRSFLRKSKLCVESIIEGFQEKDTFKIQKGVIQNRNLLVEMGENLGIEIETPILSRLCDIANKHGGYAKFSGAGGGDCGIALFKGDLDLSKLKFDWKMEGIKHLPLEVYKEGKDDK